MKPLPKGTILFLATGAFSGYAPVMPGTFGSAAAIPLFCLMARLPLSAYLVVTALFIALSIVIAGSAERYVGVKDPPCVVVDEFAGVLVAMASFEPTWQYILAGFVLFRFFDVVKPYPANVINDTVGGGTGIVLDDVVAGVYANVCMQAARLLLF